MKILYQYLFNAVFVFDCYYFVSDDYQIFDMKTDCSSLEFGAFNDFKSIFVKYY